MWSMTGSFYYALLAIISPIFPVSPAPPPKRVWVIAGMKSMLRMKAMKTMTQGIRFSNHFSIE